jgi:hypothetical protein
MNKNPVETLRATVETLHATSLRLGVMQGV